MNRLIIIGNGFDLAHGLKTRYSDFMSNYWSSINGSRSDGLIDYYCPDELENTVKGASFKHFEDDFQLLRNKSSAVQFEVQSEFFKLLNTECEDCNWADVEALYYNSLLNNIKAINHRSDTAAHKKALVSVKSLNSSFKTIKEVFAQYLHQIEYGDYEETSFKSYIEAIFRKKGLKGAEMLMIKDHLTTHPSNGIITNDLSESDFTFKQNHILNFNYTKTLSHYYSLLRNPDYNFEITHIHGKLDDPNNPIVFGFGDEKDATYQEIENLNDNEYLKFIKSSAYLQNHNYQRITNFINSDDYVIDILGHSCGLSDRTLLNTLFEHKNCQLITPHYHQYGNSSALEENDNFTHLVNNISRHFTSKSELRRKVANKKLCKPLPQIIDNYTKKEVQTSHI